MLATEFKQQASSFADLLNYAFLCEDGVVMLKDGSLLTAWYYQGPDLNSASAEELASLNNYFSEVIKSFEHGWMLQADVFRKESSDYPENNYFPDPTSKLIDQIRKTSYTSEKRHYENVQTLCLTFKPPIDLENSFKSIFHKNRKLTSEPSAAENIKYFLNIADNFEDRFSHRLQISRMNSEELITYLAACIKPLSTQASTLRIPDVPIFLDCFLATAELCHGFYPKIGSSYLSTLAINGFPLCTYPEMLSILNNLPMEYRWSSRFIFVDSQHVAGEFEKYRRKWFSKRKNAAHMLKEALKINVNESEEFQNQDALNMAEDVDQAITEIASNSRIAGYYTTTVVLYNEDKNKLEVQAREIVKNINRLGFIASIEKINALEAYLGSLPGHGTHNLKKPVLNNVNFSHLAPYTSVWAGLDHNPCPLYPDNSPTLMYSDTEGSTPFRLNLHVSDVGHTLILGPTGSGKSTLLGLIMAQFLRYKDAQIFAFDKDYSAYSLVTACNGLHYDIGKQDQDQISFCPLSEIDRPEELSWAHDWLETLCSLQGVIYTPEKRSLQFAALKTLANSQSRTLCNLNFQDPDLREAIKHYTIVGGLPILDAEVDSIKNSNFQVFEISKLMAMGEKNVIPVLLYLFHAIERKLDGRPSLIVLEEAWLLLANSSFKAKIEDWLRTMRKKNAAVIFVTQSLAEIVNSELKNLILESCPTKIFLPNAQAASEHVAEQYKKIGLSKQQIKLIASATAKQEYYYTSPLGNRLFSLNLDPVSLSFIARADRESLKQIRSLRKTNPKNWQATWLSNNAQTQAATEWLKLSEGINANIN